MKVVHKKGLDHGEKQSFTLRFQKKTIQDLDKLCNENRIFRQRLIEAILEQVLVDKKFTLELLAD